MDKNIANDISINARLEREYKGYNLFDQVSNKRIQTWNRFSIILNILANPKEGATIAGNYLTQLGKEGKQAVEAMIVEVKQKGFTKLHKEVWDTNV